MKQDYPISRTEGWVIGTDPSSSSMTFYAPNEIVKRRAQKEDMWLSERLRYALTKMEQSVTVDPDIRDGTPVILGTRMPLSRVVAELAASKCVVTISRNLEIDHQKVRGFLECLAIHLDNPVGHVDSLPSRRVRQR